MALFRNKTKLILTLFVLLLFVWVNFNLSYYSHFHIDENGKIIVHAHPFAKTERHGNSATHHTHTQSEYIYLASIYSTLVLFIVCIFLISFLLQIHPQVKREPLFQWTPGDIFRSAIFRRGPPSALQSI